MSEKRQPQSPHLLKAAGAMGFATFLSRIMGLIREQVFAFLFGAGDFTDAFNVAFRIPNLLRDLFAEGAMSASLVPTFTQTKVEEGEDRAWRVAGLVFRVLFVVVSVIAGFGIIFAPELVSLYAGAFKNIPHKFELTVSMTRIMFPFFPVVALAAAFMGVLNACGIFFIPAFASALFNVTSITVGVFFVWAFQRWGVEFGLSPIEGMACGVLAGGIVQAFCQVPSLYRVGYRWKGKKDSDPPWRKDPRLHKMLWMMIPGTIGLAATQVNILVNTILATSQGPGAVSWLNYSFRLMQFPIGIFGVSLAAATLPKVSYQWASKDVAGVSKTLTQSLNTVFAVNLPASAGLAFLGIPIIELIFQYGRFQSTDTAATAMALAAYALGLTAYSAVKVLVPACYALGNTRLPVVSSVLTVAITLILNLLMIKQFGYWGLALGTSVAAMANCGFLLIGIRKLILEKKGSFLFAPLVKRFVQYLIIACLMGVFCKLTDQVLRRYFGDLVFQNGSGKTGVVLGRAFKLGLVILEGGAWVILLSKIFGLSEVNEVCELFVKKMKNKLRPTQT